MELAINKSTDIFDRFTPRLHIFSLPVYFTILELAGVLSPVLPGFDTRSVEFIFFEVAFICVFLYTVTEFSFAVHGIFLEISVIGVLLRFEEALALLIAVGELSGVFFSVGPGFSGEALLLSV